MTDSKKFKDDITAAERNLLVFSWLGILTALGLFAFSIWGI